MNQPEQMPDPFAELLREGARLSETERLAARNSFLARVDGEATASSKQRRTVWVASVALAAAALLAYIAWPTSELGYQVSGAVSERGYIHTASSESARIEFSDKTLLTADPRTRLRIVETQEHGARISIEQGTLHVAVTHEQQTEWQFVAGPFQVHVTGTRFDLDWDPEQERLSVLLHEGSVNVEGYAGSGLVAVNAGQRFLGDARSRTMQVHDVAVNHLEPIPRSGPDSRAASTTSPDDIAPPSAPGAPALNGAATPQKPSSTPAENESWSSLISRGDFKRVVADANRRGVAQCISNCSAEDLNALADAARYTGEAALAERALLSLRQRFASSDSNRAAFLLGRLYEGQGKQSKALDWYNTALRQSPGGPFAPESLAGKMRTVSAVQGKTAAVPIAREYLRRYPGGVHAGAARQLAQTP